MTARWNRFCLGTLIVWLTLVGAGPSAEPRRLTSDGRFKESPTAIDPAGNELAYSVQESPQLMRAMRLRLADGVVGPLNPDCSKNEFEPTFSRDGTWLASVQSRGNLSLALVVRPYPQGQEVELPPDGGFCGYRCPAFSPDGKLVYYSFADRDRQSIMVVGRQGGERKTIIDGPGHANWPTLSPDGGHLAFASTRDGNYEIYMALADGSQIKRLTDHPRQDMRPKFSPDGRRLAFTSARDGNYEIYVMHSDGSQLRRLTNHPERDDYAAWHPNGRQLFFIGERDGKHDVYSLDVDE